MAAHFVALMAVFDTGDMAARYGKRLAIIVPYRDRPQHLKEFLPHMANYFQRDKLDRYIAVSIHIVEQGGTAAFNRGKILNCGYQLAREGADYVCFHDVDYLPLWADYSWSAKPARLIWYGLRMREDPEHFFGAVTLFDKTAFEAANGYPNVYWGWGPEDAELGRRCHFAGFGFDRRDGTYLALPHPDAGFIAPGIWTEEARQTHVVFEQRRDHLKPLMRKDGLSSLKFKLVEKRPISIAGHMLPNSFHYVVDLGQPEPVR
jgi:hypothetical protein